MAEDTSEARRVIYHYESCTIISPYNTKPVILYYIYNYFIFHSVWMMRVENRDREIHRDRKSKAEKWKRWVKGKRHTQREKEKFT